MCVNQSRRSTRTQRLLQSRQGTLLDFEPVTKAPVSAPTRVVFEHGDRAELFVGSKPLQQFLKDSGLGWVLRFGELMDDELDWTAFEAAYEPGGRPPLHPRRVLGLMMYAALLKQASLRQTEALAVRDVGAWWLTGGLTPDHTTIARFIGRHESLLTEDFFEGVTSRIAKHLGAMASDLVIDGTVKKAVASSAGALKREALERKRSEAKDAVAIASFAVTEAVAAGAPDTAEVMQRAEVAQKHLGQLEAAHIVLVEREEARKAAGKSIDDVQVSPTEPEAVMQPLKQSNDFGLGYKPVVGAHPSGLIVAQNLSAASETEHVSELVAQHERVLGRAPERVLADAGFSAIHVLAFLVAQALDALIPSGGNGKPRSGRLGLFGKSEFHFIEEEDRVLCPAGKKMTPGPPQKDRHGNTHREFRTTECKTCPLLAKCTKAKSKSRVYKRYAGDELKDAMNVALSNPVAQAAYKRRSTIVEPVFARLGAAGFTRFRRSGLRRAKTEFALKCSAHNIALFLGRWRAVVVVFCAIRLPDGSWCAVVVGAEVTT